MIAVDTNILMYAHRRSSPFHEVCVAAIDRLVGDGGPWAIPWPCVHEFYNTTTNLRRMAPPSSPEQAFHQIDEWRSAGAEFIGEVDNHVDRLRQLVIAGRVIGPRVHDAKIAAICLSHGISELWTADRDFSRFPRLKTRNPLVSTG